MKHTISFLILLFTSIFVFAQDPCFSQYNSTRMNANPAFAGTDSALAISQVLRLEWLGINGGYKTYYFSADKYLRAIRSGLGISYSYNDEMNGTYKTTKVDICLAPHFEFFKHKLVLQTALQASFYESILDWYKLTWPDMITQNGFTNQTKEKKVDTRISYPDFSFGLLMYGKRFYGGIAINHLTQPNETFFKQKNCLPRKYTFHFGANLNYDAKKLILSPNMLYIKQGEFQNILLGVTAKYKWAIFGLNYGNNAMIMNIGFQNRIFKAGYSYDYTVSTLTNRVTYGTHELQIAVFLRKKNKVCKIRTLQLI